MYQTARLPLSYILLEAYVEYTLKLIVGNTNHTAKAAASTEAVISTMLTWLTNCCLLYCLH